MPPYLPTRRSTPPRADVRQLCGKNEPPSPLSDRRVFSRHATYETHDAERRLVKKNDFFSSADPIPDASGSCAENDCAKSVSSARVQPHSPAHSQAKRGDSEENEDKKHPRGVR